MASPAGEAPHSAGLADQFGAQGGGYREGFHEEEMVAKDDNAREQVAVETNAAVGARYVATKLNRRHKDVGSGRKAL